MLTYQTPLDLVRDLRPQAPVACVRPKRAALTAGWFQEHFPGEVLYAVKANPSLWALDALYRVGQRWFDVASLDEIKLISSRYPDAVLAYMNPVKNREAIQRAYYAHDVRIFALDCGQELQKILDATDGARDLTFVVRLDVDNDGAQMPLTGKFGCARAAAADLLKASRQYADKLGVSFHVGSQCMDPGAYRRAMAKVSDAIVDAGVMVDIVDVGGGFPAPYPGMTPPDLRAYLDVVVDAFEAMPVLMNADLWCEPGRALVAGAGTILTKVELVKGDAVYLNDGAYGNLHDAAHCNWPYPVRAHRADGALADLTKAFQVFGPTCDALDRLARPVELPADLAEGDYVEFGMLGAYGVALQSRFNGFGETLTVAVADADWAEDAGSRDQDQTDAVGRRADILGRTKC